MSPPISDLGYDVNGASTDSWAANLFMGIQLTAPEDIVVVAGCFYSGASVVNSRMFVYSDAAGVPSAMLANSPPVVLAAGGGLVVHPLLVTITSGTVFWLGQWADGDPAMKFLVTATTLWNQYKPGAGTWSAGALPDLSSWTSVNTNTNRYSIFCRYWPVQVRPQFSRAAQRRPDFTKMAALN